MIVISKWKAYTLRMLPDVTHSAVPKQLTQVRHIIPPVAPITLNTTGFTKVNQDFDKKHLSAFVDGASDHLCVAAARRVIKGEFCLCLHKLQKGLHHHWLQLGWCLETDLADFASAQQTTLMTNYIAKHRTCKKDY